MNKQSVRILVLGFALIFVLSCVPAAVFAQDEEGGDDATTVSIEEGDNNSNRGEQLKSRLQELKAERQQKNQERLAAAKLRVCQQRQSKIKAIINRSVTRAEKQLTLFTTIAERVKVFYAEKGRTVANYDELVAAVDAAKADAQSNLSVLKNLDPFECDVKDPKGNAEAFKVALRMVNEDLKTYRTAVKNLIVGVKSAQGTAQRSEQ